MSLSEFALIKRYFAPLSQSGDKDAGVVLGIGDDCALLETPADHQLAVSIDTLVEGSHFLPGTHPEYIASRAFGSCLSDLAAMGAKPAWFTLALTLPNIEETWLESFAATLSTLSKEHGIVLVGGDTTKGATLTISIQVHGWVPRGKAIRRDTANVGDRIFITGTLGDSAAGLDQLQRDGKNRFLIGRFNRPTPRIATGLAIREWASACIDVSDGLLQDLGHILQQSGLGAVLDSEHIPMSPALRESYSSDTALQMALAGGEDFELCFCVPEDQIEGFLLALQNHPVRLTEIGYMVKDRGLWLLHADGMKQSVDQLGFQHF